MTDLRAIRASVTTAHGAASTRPSPACRRPLPSSAFATWGAEEVWG